MFNLKIDTIMIKPFAIILLTSLIGLPLQANEPEGNPFKKLGYKTNVSTFSDYQEFHDQSKIVQIGSIWFDTNTNEVVGIVQENTVVELRAELISTTIDPYCEKYYSISPYAYCMNNPVNLIDPDGRDVWEINNEGKIVNHIKDKTQDAFYMVSKDSNGKYQRVYTTDADGNKNYNSISFEYGTITDSKKANFFRNATSFSVGNESAGGELFKFFADNTNIEFGLINTLSNGSTVMTNHRGNSVNATGTAKKLSDNGQTVTSIIHNHPNNTNPSGFRNNDVSGDKFAANFLTGSRGYTVERYVYQPQTGNLVMYNEKSIIGSMPWRLLFSPSKSRTFPVRPMRRYPGVGLPPP